MSESREIGKIIPAITKQEIATATILSANEGSLACCVKIYRQAFCGRASADSQHQIWSVDAVTKRRTMKPIERPSAQVGRLAQEAKLFSRNFCSRSSAPVMSPWTARAETDMFSFNSRADDCILRALIINNVDQNPEDVSFSCVMHSPLHRSILSS